VVLSLLAALCPAVARADDSPERGAEPVLGSLTTSSGGLFWLHHSTRLAGGEAQVRADVWQGGRWSLHLGYTPDVIVDQPTVAGTIVEGFHDLNLGAKWVPSSGVPIWLWGEGHGLLGSFSGTNGGGFLVGIGASWKGLSVALGAGGVFLVSERSVNVTGTLSYQFIQWLSLSVLGIVTLNEPYVSDGSLGVAGTHGAYGAELRLGPFSGVGIDLRWLGGERVLAIDQEGTLLENLPDILRDTFNLTIRFPIARRWSGFVGAAFQFAAQPSGNPYGLGSALAGVSFFF
jgi:hypothetical protein